MTATTVGARAQAAPPDAEVTAARVEELLARLTDGVDPATAAAAEELVRALMEFYGAGLAQIVALLSGRSGNPLGALLDDQVTAGLLVLHDLHPDDVRARIDRALRAADVGPLEVVGFDADAGTLTLRQAPDTSGCGCGCGSTGDSLRRRVEAALAGLAPEVSAVELAAPEAAHREPPLLQIGPRPGAATPAETP